MLKKFVVSVNTEVLLLDAILMQQPVITNTMTLPHNRLYFFKLFISITLFLVSGGLSTYLYYSLQGKGGVYFPGLLYTSTTVIIFLLTKKEFQTKNLLKYWQAANRAMHCPACSEPYKYLPKNYKLE